jgi:hypothetical protein
MEGIFQIRMCKMVTTIDDAAHHRVGIIGVRLRQDSNADRMPRFVDAFRGLKNSLPRKITSTYSRDVPHNRPSTTVLNICGGRTRRRAAGELPLWFRSDPARRSQPSYEARHLWLNRLPLKRARTN